MSTREIQEKTPYPSSDLNFSTPIGSLKILLAENVRWPNVALLAINFAKAGNIVSAVCPARHFLSKTRAVRKTFHYSGLRPLESLRAAIEATGPDIIIPCDDRTVQNLHELHDWARRMGSSGDPIRALIEKSLGLPESYSVVFARSEFLQIAREEKLRVPETAPINTEDDFKSWQVRQAFPWVLKADGTFGGSGVKIAHTLSQAQKHWQELSRFYTTGRAIKRLCVNRDAFWLRPSWKGIRPRISVQAYIHGRPANCAVVCWKGKVLADIGVEVVSSAGTTGPANIVRVVDNPDMMNSARRLASRLGLSGFFGLDFMIEEGSGLAYLIEINPRPTRVSCLQLGGQNDLVEALCAQLSGRAFREMPPATQNKMIAYFPDARNSDSKLLNSCHHDTPEGEPDLVQELLKPWPPKGFLWHLYNQADRLKTLLGNLASKYGSKGKS